MDIKKFPKDISNKILNYVIEINISKRKKIWNKIHSELFKGYFIEEKGTQLIFRSSMLRITYNKELFNKLLNECPIIFEEILNESNIMPNNYLNYNDSYISEVELKDIDYYWIIRIPKLISE